MHNSRLNENNDLGWRRLDIRPIPSATKSLFSFIFRKGFEPSVRFAAFRGVLGERTCQSEPEISLMAWFSR